MLVLSMWFDNIMRWFFFNIDKVVFNWISYLYEILISIARTSVLTQADIADMAGRIYKLLAIFMIFKVTLSLITYVVNPDDFTDKSKGVSKLTMNIIISLSLLILTPYIFSYAFQFQTIILEDNSLATLIFGKTGDDDFLTTAGDDMAFIAMSPFFTPNVSITELYDCTELTIIKSDGTVSFNPECSGLDSDLDDLGDANSMMGLTSDDRFNKTWLENYVSGVEAESLPLMFRSDIATATDKKNENYIIDYKYFFSTAVGIVIVLLLITFCMDVGLRSIKLSFLQLIAPIPILSYVDPKSGKDGLFKKWYEMCFKTYLSLFIRLLALYFSIYIISKVADGRMVDIVDGSYVTNLVVKIFIIIGALMFAKQLPKMLEGLGIKLDGGGKFTLNPLKKFEEEAIGGKRITGGARGLLAGTAGALTGAGLANGLKGAYRGIKDGKGWKDAGKATAEMNRKMRQAKLDGSTFGGRLMARGAGMLGLPSESDLIGNKTHKLDERIKENKNKVSQLELTRDAEKAEQVEIARKAKIPQASLGKVKEVAIEKMKDGKGEIGKKYEAAVDRRDAISSKLGEKITFIDHEGKTQTREVTAEDISLANNAVRDLERDGWMQLVNEVIADEKVDAKLATQLRSAYSDYSTSQGVSEEAAREALGSGTKVKDVLGSLSGSISDAEAAQRRIDEKYFHDIKTLKDRNEELEEEKRELYERERKAKANETAIKE